MNTKPLEQIVKIAVAVALALSLLQARFEAAAMWSCILLLWVRSPQQQSIKLRQFENRVAETLARLGKRSQLVK